MRLGTKILSLAPIAVAGMLVVGAVFLTGYQFENRQRAEVAEIQAIQDVATELELSFLQARRSEKDLLLRRDEKYIDRHANVVAGAVTQLDQLDTALETGFADAMAGEVGLLRDAFGQYQSRFAELVDAIQAKGFDEKTGLQGALRSSVHAAEESLKEIGNAELTVKMLMMRRHEKDFIMRVNQKYVGRLDDRVTEFKAFPASAFGSAAKKAQVIDFIDAYQSDFHKFADVTVREMELRKQLSAAFADAEPHFEAIQSFVTDTTSNLMREIEENSAVMTRVLIGAVLLVILIVAGLAYLIARSVSAPLAASVASLQDLAAGNSDIDVTGVDRTDEIGDIARAIVHFRDAAIEKQRIEHEIDENRSQSERERSEREAATAAEAKNLNTAIETLGEGLQRLSDGDLTVSIETTLEGRLDHLRSDFNASVRKLAATLSDVKSGIGTFHANAGEMRSGVEDLSRRTEQQAASLEETSAALEQITSTVKSSSERAQDASKMAAQANESTEASTVVVTKAVSAMSRIEGASGEIAKIIGVIDEIAFQTNLLALNAGVEAARAGEAGKGFAVVAQEVRELAQRSASAAKEIKELIDRSGVEVADGVDLVKQTGEALGQIAAHVRDINGHIEAIATASQEQTTGLREVNTAVSQMDQVTQQNAAMVEETTAVTVRLADDADELNGLVSGFQIADHQPVRLVGGEDTVLDDTVAPTRTPVPPMPRASSGGALAVKQEEWTEF